MKFKVSSKVKGSLILKSIGRPVSSGAILYIEGHSLYADDIQRAIKSGLIESVNKEDKIEIQENIIDKTTEVVVINKTDRTVIVGNVSIRPNGSTIKDIADINLNAIKQAVKRGLIQVIRDVDEDMFEDVSPTEEIVEKVTDVSEIEQGIDILEEKFPTDELADFIKEIESEKIEEIEEVKSVVWDAKQQKMVKPQTAPKTGQQLLYDEEEGDIDTIDTEETEEISMIDDLDAINEIDEVKDSKADISDKIDDKIDNIKKKIKTKNKKKAKKASKKKVIGTIKPKTTEVLDSDIAVAMDSMGRPLKNDMSHMIEIGEPDEVSFADAEQAQEKIDIAKNRDSKINIDLD